MGNRFVCNGSHNSGILALYACAQYAMLNFEPRLDVVWCTFIRYNTILCNNHEWNLIVLIIEIFKSSQVFSDQHECHD